MAEPRAALANAIRRRPRVTPAIALLLAVAFAVVLVPIVTAEHWIEHGLGVKLVAGEPAPMTVRVPPLTGFISRDHRMSGGGVVIARGQLVGTAAVVQDVDALEASLPNGAMLAVSVALLVGVLAFVFSHHMRRSIYGRLLRVQIASLALIAAVAIAVKLLLLTTAASILVVPVALFALVPTLCLDRMVGMATGVLAALVLATLAPFDLDIAILLLAQVSVAGLVVAERPKHRWTAALTAGVVSTAATAFVFPVLHYLTRGELPALDATTWQSPWLAAALGPAIATALAVPLVPLYQRLVGEITRGKLIELEDLSNPSLVQIASRAPGTWQHSLAMANFAEIAANAIGADGRLVRVGAYYHDLGKSLQPKFFIENLEAGETSPHDSLTPEQSCAAIFEHVTEGIKAARRAGLPERVIDFMHMHHGSGVLEYFWARCREQGNPRGLTVDDFRYPGVPPHSRETAILALVDAVEAAARTLTKPDAAAVDSLVQRIVYGKLHLGQLDDSGLTMGDLRRMTDALRDAIRHANHGRIAYPWQKEQSSGAITAPATAPASPVSSGASQSLRLDSLDRKPAAAAASAVAAPRAATAPPMSNEELAVVETAPAMARPGRSDRRTGRVHAIATPADSLDGSTRSPAAPADAPAEAPAPDVRSDAAITAPRPAAAIEAETAPPVRSDAAITLPRIPAVTDVTDVTDATDAPAPTRASSKQWLTGLAARIDAALVVNEDSHAEPATPPLERTRQQSIDEIEALHREARAPSDSTRRQSVDEIEALHRKAKSAVDRTAPPFGGAAGRDHAPTVDRTAPPFGGAAGRGHAPTVDQTAPPFGGAAGRDHAPTVDQTAPPFGGAAGRGHAPTVDQTAPPFGGAAGRGHAPTVEVGEPDILESRIDGRRIHPLRDMDPDDLEAVIELARPRAPTPIGVAKKKPVP